MISSLSFLIVIRALSIILGIPILALFIKLIEWGGDLVALYLFGTSVALSLIFMVLIPVFIMPLFNKFEDLKEGTLKTKIEDLAKELKFPLKKLYVCDASKRSSHSNAFFYGFGGNKRIVVK